MHEKAPSSLVLVIGLLTARVESLSALSPQFGRGLGSLNHSRRSLIGLLTSLLTSLLSFLGLTLGTCSWLWFGLGFLCISIDCGLGPLIGRFLTFLSGKAAPPCQRVWRLGRGWGFDWGVSWKEERSMWM